MRPRKRHVAVLLLPAVAACSGAAVQSRRASSSVEAPVTLVPHRAPQDVLSAILEAPEVEGAAPRVALVDLHIRADSTVEYTLRLSGMWGSPVATGYLLHLDPSGAEEQVATFFVGAALSRATPEVRGTLSIGKTVTLSWLVEELRRNPARFSAVFRDAKGAEAPLRGQFR